MRLTIAVWLMSRTLAEAADRLSTDPDDVLTRMAALRRTYTNIPTRPGLLARKGVFLTPMMGHAGTDHDNQFFTDGAGGLWYRTSNTTAACESCRQPVGPGGFVRFVAGPQWVGTAKHRCPECAPPIYGRKCQRM
jgi:hypothetical protein